MLILKFKMRNTLNKKGILDIVGPGEARTGRVLKRGVYCIIKTTMP